MGLFTRYYRRHVGVSALSNINVSLRQLAFSYTLINHEAIRQFGCKLERSELFGLKNIILRNVNVLKWGYVNNHLNYACVVLSEM